MLLGVLVSLSAFAQDFEYTYEGQTLTYTITGDNTCQTKAGFLETGDSYISWGCGNDVSNSLVIPAVAVYGTKEYSVTAIGDYAFIDCKKLTSVVIPESVTIISESAFSDCSRLTSINIPTSVTTIGYSAFSGCICLTSIEIPESVTAIGESAFSGCSRLTNIDIPESITNIGSYVFSDCGSLIDIDIPKSVTNIGFEAFSNCKNLISIVIPESVTTIGDGAFSGCSGLTYVYYKTVNPIEANDNIFSYETYKGSTLYLAKGGFEKAIETEPWCRFDNINEVDFSGIDDIVTDAEIDFSAPVEVYNINGVLVSDNIDNLSSGIYIVRQGNKTKKIAVK